MIDYISTDIVQYTSESDYRRGSLGYYPLQLDISYVRTQEINLTTPWYYPTPVPYFDLVNMVEAGLLDSELVENYSNCFYWLCCIRDEDNQTAAVESYQLYYLSVSYIRISVYTYNLPDYYNPTFEGNDVFWLYNFGNYLVSRMDKLSNLLNIQIKGYNLLSLVFGSGFIVYAGWCVIKWIIPL